MKHFCLSYLWVIILSVQSCSPSKETKPLADSSVILTETDTLCLRINPSTTQIISYINPYLEGDDFRMACLSRNVSGISILDLTSERELTAIPIFSEGPDAVDLPDVKAIVHVGPDSTILYEYWTRTLSCVNNSGHIVWRDTLSDISAVHASYSYTPIATTPAPLTKYKDGWLTATQTSGTSTDNEPIHTMAIYNADGLPTAQFADYPEIYGNPSPIRWNLFLYLIPSFTIDSKNNIIVSFPASDSIRVYGHNLEYTPFYAGYSKAEVPSPSENALIDQSHALDNYAYTSILYDPHNALYYRIVACPVNDTNATPIQGQAIPRPLAIVVLDSDFNKVGEYAVDNYSGSYSQVFVSPKGLHIHSYSDNDDILKFRTFTPM